MSGLGGHMGGGCSQEELFTSRNLTDGGTNRDFGWVVNQERWLLSRDDHSDTILQYDKNTISLYEIQHTKHEL